MLLRFISSVSVLLFALLLMSGSQVEVALYRSLIAFLILFTGTYLAVFAINILQHSAARASSGTAHSSGSANRMADPDGKKTSNNMD